MSLGKCGLKTKLPFVYYKKLITISHEKEILKFLLNFHSDLFRAGLRALKKLYFANAIKMKITFLSKKKRMLVLSCAASNYIIKAPPHRLCYSSSRFLRGVPQGSCLSPVLFLLYASGLFKVMAKHLPEAHYTYANDCQSYFSFKP